MVSKLKGFAFALQSADCIDTCCFCAKSFSVYFCCPFADCPEPDILEPGGPIPGFWVMDGVFSGGACGHWDYDDGHFIVDRPGSFSYHASETATFPYSCKVNGTTYSNSVGMPAFVSAGDVISDFTMHATHCDVECILKAYGYGLWDGADGHTVSTHVCYGITYSGTAPGIVSNVDCSETVNCVSMMEAGAAVTMSAAVPAATPEISPPSVLQRALNFVQAIAGHVADGMQKRSEPEIKALHAICAGIGTDEATGKRRVKCGFFDPAKNICMHGACGCNVSEVADKFLNKLAWRSEQCPAGKW